MDRVGGDGGWAKGWESMVSGGAKGVRSRQDGGRGVDV